MHRVLAPAAVLACLLGPWAQAQTFESQVESVRARATASFSLFNPVHPTTADQRRRALALTFLFENEQPYCLYDYVQDLNDGRGYTAGCIGFNVRSGTVRDVIERYTKLRPVNALSTYTHNIYLLESVPEIDHQTLDAMLPNFVMAWQTVARSDALFRQAQDQAVNEGFAASVREADALGIRSALGRAIIYDTSVQHGGEDAGQPDPDSLPPMARKATAALGGGPLAVGEKRWLTRFLKERRKILSNPNDPNTKGAWATSVDRVDTFLMLLKQGNMDLHGPLDTRPYFDAVIP